MADKIRVEDIIDERLKKELKEIAANTEKVIEQFKALLAVSKQVDTELKKGVATQEQLSKTKKTTTDNTKKLSDVEKEVAKIEEQHYQVLTKMVAEQSKENKVLEDAKAKRAEQNRVTKESIALAKTEAGSIARLTAENKKLIKERDAVNTKTVEGQKKIAQLNTKINENNKAINQNKSLLEQQKNNVGNYGSAWDKAKFAIVTFAAGLAAANGVIKFATGVIKSAQGASDAFEAEVMAMKNAWALFNKSIATGDLGNLVQRLKDAANAGRDYANALDDLGDRQRAVDVRESKARLEIIKLEEQRDNVLLSNNERLEAAYKIAEKEEALFKDKGINADKRYKAEINNLTKLAGLSEEQIINFITNYDRTEAAREAAEKYNKQLEITKKTTASLTKEFVDAGIHPLIAFQMAADVIDTAAKSMSGASTETKMYAEILRGVGKTTDEELDNLVKAWNGVDGAEIEYYENIKKNSKKTSALLKEIQEKENADSEKSRANRKKQEEKDAKEKQERLDRELKVFDTNTQKRINAATNEFINGKRSAQALSDEIITITIEETEKKLQYAKDNGLEILDLETTLLGLKKQLKDAELSDFEKTEEAKRKAADDTAKMIEGYEKDLQKTKADIGWAAFDLFQTIGDRQISKIEEQKEVDLTAAGDNEREKTRIEERYAKRIASMKRQQAIADKAAAIFNIGLSTAQAIIGFQAKPGGALGVSLSVAAGIMGALQAATVLAQPIPKFAKGVHGFGGGFATVGEQGFELFRTKDNQIGITPDTATTMFLPKGTDVFTHNESERIISGNSSVNLDISPLINEQRLTRKALANKVEHNTTFTDKGMKYSITKNGTRITYLDKYIRS